MLFFSDERTKRKQALNAIKDELTASVSDQPTLKTPQDLYKTLNTYINNKYAKISSYDDFALEEPLS